METKLAETIVEACLQNGVKAEIKDNYSESMAHLHFFIRPVL